MGRPPELKKQRRRASPASDINRRGFFARSSAAATTALALPALADNDRRGGPDRDKQRAAFAHGVASGDPRKNSVILWTRLTPRSPEREPIVLWFVAADAQMRRVVDGGVTRTDAGRDFTVKVEPRRLAPGHTYYYRFFSQGAWSPVGRTRTLPAAGVSHLRLAVVSCSNHAAGYFNAYRQIARRADLDAVVHLGDYLYEYGPAQYGSTRQPDPPFEMVSLSDYRRRHAQYKADVDLQEVHRQHPMICIWDDHEITNDAWRDGAQNHTEGAEGTWPDRVAAGLKAYYEWMPVRVADGDDLRRNQRAFRFGDLMELVMLEERLQARSQQLPATIPVPGLGNGFVQAGPFTDPSRTLLGAEQEAWLARRLRESDAQWKFIGQQVMFAQLKLVAAPLAAGGGVFVNSDQWDGYQPARDRVYDIFKGDGRNAGVANCVVLTGDIHSSWAADLTQDPSNPLLAGGGYDAVSGQGSRAVEFVATSVTSPGLDDPAGSTAAFLRSVNPHFKYIDLNRRGYCLLDVKRERTVCEWWYVDTVASISHIEIFGVAFEVQAGTNRLVASAQTAARLDAPALAPS